MSNLILPALKKFFLGLYYLFFLGLYLFLLVAPFPASWEWSQLVGCHRWYQKLGYVLLSVVCFWVLFYAFVFLFYLRIDVFVLPILVLFLSILATLFIFYYAQKNTVASFSVCYGAVGLFILPLVFLIEPFFIFVLRDFFAFLPMLFLGVWVPNIFSSFVGKHWGKHKLAPAIDPEKTIEGALAALFLVIVSASIVALWYHFTLKKSLYLILSGCVLLHASIVGNLFVSLMKKARDVKVTGRLLLGYGGVLDGISHLIFVIPMIAFFTWLYMRITVLR